MSTRHIARFVLAVVFCLALIAGAISAQAQTYKVLYTFGNVSLDPIVPYGAIAQGRDGSLYTTSIGGGVGNVGTVFNVSPSGTMTLVFSFNYDPGNDPLSGVTLGSDGNYYGTTKLNGEGPGTAWQVTPTGTGTALHYFGNSGDGACPWAGPIEGTDGNYYGTTTTVCGFGSLSTIYKLTSTGTLTTLYTFTDGSNVTAALIQATDGNFYGVTESGGANGDGEIFKMTPSGAVTTVHSFAGSDGNQAYSALIQGTDGNLYGVAYAGGTSNKGVVFKCSTTGTYSVLYNFTGSSTDGGAPSGLMQASSGTLYGGAQIGGASNAGTLYSISTSGTFKLLYSFGGANGADPSSPLKQNTNGILYGVTYQGGNTSLCGGSGCGVFYSLNIGAKPFIRLSSTSGKVGSQVGIFGQGFSSSSVVKFNGVQATKTTLTGTTYLTATVPTGAVDGYVTVTTGSTTLTSTKTFTVHNSWGQGAAIPVPVICPAVGFIGGKIYVVGGGNGTVPVGNNQVYNTANNTWSTAAAMPTPVGCAAYAVVAGILYVIGGSPTNTTFTDTVQAYDPATNTWSTKTPMPIARGSIPAAVVDGKSIYVMGGNGTTLRLDNLEKYDTTTDTWTEESPLLVGRSETTGGLLGTTIVSSDGDTNSGPTGDTEAYDVSTNTWSELTADPTARGGPCFAAISGQLYLAGGNNPGGGVISLTESFNLNADKWTTLLSIPNAVEWSGSTVANGQLYCFGGTPNNGTTADNYVQIYQP